MTGIHRDSSIKDVLLLVLSLSVLGLLSSESARAVVPDRAIPDIPLVYRPGVGVRAIGMGGAVSASIDSYEALNYNPASLALVRRMQITGSVERRKTEEDQSFDGYSGSSSHTKNRLHSLGFAYPYPTYRGSLVIGFGYDVVTPFDYGQRLVGTRGPVYMEEDMVLDGALGAWTAGFAIDVSPRVSLGAAGIILLGASTSERSYYMRAPSEGGFEILEEYEKTDTEFTGVTGRLGALVRLDQGINVGMVLHLPERIDRVETIVTDEIRVTPGGEDDAQYWIDRLDQEFTLPFRVTGALAYTAMLGPGDITLAGDATYADWKEIDYAGRIRARGLGYAYRSTIDSRLGAEYTFPRPLPVSLRAGFASIPLAYRPINVDVIEDEDGVLRDDYVNASIGRDRRAWTMGLGVQVDPTLRIDLAYVRSSYERSGRSMAGAVTAESVHESRLLMGVLLEL